MPTQTKPKAAAAAETAMHTPGPWEEAEAQRDELLAALKGVVAVYGKPWADEYWHALDVIVRTQKKQAERKP